MNESLVNKTPHNFRIESSQIFEIDKFPKEFKRDWFHSLDFRFISIFFITLIFAVVSVRHLYFKNTLSEKFTSVQQAYIHFFDNRQFYDTIDDVFENDLTVSAYETEVPSEKISSLNQDQINDNISEQTKPISHSTSKNKLLIESVNYSNANNKPITDEKSSAANSNTSPSVSAIQQDSLLTIAELDMQNALVSAVRNHSLHQSNQHKIRGVRTENLLFKDAVQSIAGRGKEPVDDDHQTTFTKNENWSDIPSSASAGNKKSAESLRSGDAISKVIISHNRTIQDCYKQSLKRDPTIKGKITLRFSVSTDGHVRDVEIIKSTLKDELLERCIVSRIKKWEDFGVISGGSDEIYYRQSFVFGK